MKPVLMIAYHFPPLAGSSGIQRGLRFMQHLPAAGWQPIVLTTHPRAYEKVSADLMSEVPASVPVHRVQAFDTARHFAVRGRYLGAMARPDRWISWRFDAVRVGLRLIRQHRPAAIWSTYPIATAHVIGAELHRRTGVPWVADFRDPMAQDGYPADPKVWQSFVDVERAAMDHAAISTFTTPGAAGLYRGRYPNAATRIEVLENGYDEESFAAAEAGQSDLSPLNPGRLTLLHSGIVYPSERDPSHLFAALSRLLAAGRLTPANFALRMRAPVHEDLLRRMAKEHGVADLVEILPPVGYRDALAEMLRADALLVLQASNCNDQIPAKIYEYLRSGRPTLCLSDPAGDTASVMRQAGLDAIAPLDSVDGIERSLPAFIEQVRSGQARLAGADFVRLASRRGRTDALAQMLSEASAAGRA